jgi:hypothetical protein
MVNEKEGKDLSHVKTGQVHLYVAEATETHYILHWSFRHIIEEGSTGDQEAEITNLLLRDRTLIYKTSETGEFQELINWENIRKDANRILDSLIKASANPEYKTLLKSYRQTLQNQAGITQVMAYNTINYHYLHGSEFSRKGALKNPTEIDNIAQPNKPFPAWIEIAVTEVKDEIGEGRFLITQTLDEEKAIPIIISNIEKLTGEKMTRKEVKEMGVYTILDEFIIEVNLNNGWVEGFYWVRSEKIFGEENTETMTLTRIR